jgi:hypothetical protein
MPGVPCRPPDRGQLLRRIAPSPYHSRTESAALGQSARLLRRGTESRGSVRAGARSRCQEIVRRDRGVHPPDAGGPASRMTRPPSASAAARGPRTARRRSVKSSPSIRAAICSSHDTRTHSLRAVAQPVVRRLPRDHQRDRLLSDGRGGPSCQPTRTQWFPRGAPFGEAQTARSASRTGTWRRCVGKRLSWSSGSLARP